MRKVRPQSMTSPLWHRVEKLRPRMRPHVRVERQVIRGEAWYVALDSLSNRSHRFTPAVYALLGRMDGTRPLGALWQELSRASGEDAPSQDEVIRLLGQLYDLELIQADGGAAVDTDELSERRLQTERRRRWQGLRNPLYLRFPIFDPDRFLAATLHLVAPLFSWLGLAAWISGVAWLGIQALSHWEPLTRNIADRVLAADNLLMILVVFPLLKLVHELGHGFATKRFGGEVHEMGIMLLIGLPVPYVDASSSAAFSSKWQRTLVGAAGMMAELAVACGAMAIWITAEPGLVRAAAFNVLVVAGVSTLVVNGNPLLRFDAYYILSDLIEVPNLASRANRYLGYLVDRYAFGLPGATPPPVLARGERFWLLAFGPASFLYRLSVMFGLALVIAKQYFVVGILMAVWTVASGIGWPLLKGLKHVLISRRTAPRRGRAVAMTAGAAAATALVLFALPIPNGTVARGLVWLPEETQVLAETNGQFQRLLAEPGSLVEAGAPLIELTDPLLISQRRRVGAKALELRHRLLQAESQTPFDVEVIRKQLELAEAELQEAERKAGALTLRSRAAGRFVLVHPNEIEGLEVKRGHLFGHVLPAKQTLVRAIVGEQDVETVLTATTSIGVRLDSAPFETLVQATLVRAVPGATRQLPSPAFGQPAGGPIAIDPTARNADTALLPFFEFDVRLPGDAMATARYGERAWVRFDHGSSPLASRLYRSARQLFLRQFNA